MLMGNTSLRLPSAPSDFKSDDFHQIHEMKLSSFVADMLLRTRASSPTASNQGSSRRPVGSSLASNCLPAPAGKAKAGIYRLSVSTRMPSGLIH